VSCSVVGTIKSLKSFTAYYVVLYRAAYFILCIILSCVYDTVSSIEESYQYYPFHPLSRPVASIPSGVVGTAVRLTLSMKGYPVGLLDRLGLLVGFLVGLDLRIARVSIVSRRSVQSGKGNSGWLEKFS
jgi:hypothetical protein